MTLILVTVADEVDVIGYGSHGSDLDDQLSVQSASSDSGIGLGNVASIGHFPHLTVVIGTRRHGSGRCGAKPIAAIQLHGHH